MKSPASIVHNESESLKIGKSQEESGVQGRCTKRLRRNFDAGFTRVTRLVRHNFAFRKVVRCGGCGRTLIGELQKHYVYYRCQTRQCPAKTVREEVVCGAMASRVAVLKLDEEELEYVRSWVEHARAREDTHREQETQSARLRLDGIRNRLSRLTDACIDGILERSLFDERKAGWLHEEKATLETIRQLEAGNGGVLQQLERFLELVKNLAFCA